MKRKRSPASELLSVLLPLALCQISLCADDSYQSYIQALAYPARLVVRPDASTVVADGRISFFCRADGNPLPNVVWKTNGKPISDSRFLSKSLPSGLSTLRIEPVLSSDQGMVVSCSADNGVANPVVAEATLTVIARDSIPSGFPVIDAHPSLKSVEQGRTAHVSCRVHGDPRPKVLWLRDLVPIDIRAEGRYSVSTIGNPGALMIQQAREEDQGRYECVARNSHGVVHSKAAHLYVKVRRVPPYFSMKLNRTYPVGSGGAVNLTCVAVGYPMPRVFWKKSDDVVLDDPATAPIGKNVLTLSNVEASENFTCVAVSKLGNIEATTTVEVKSLPPPPRHLTVSAISSDSVTLSWDKPRMDEPIRRYIVKYRQKSISPSAAHTNTPYADSNILREKSVGPEDTGITISGLEPFQLYEFSMQTVGDIGPGPVSIPREAQTSETAPSAPPTKVQARSLNRDSILVKWSPSDKPNGLITGYKIYYTNKEPTTPFPLWKTHDTKSDEMMTTLIGLEVDQKYYLHVQARNSKGNSQMSQLVTVATMHGLPGQPPSLQAKAVDSRRVQLTWEKPLYSSPVIGYVVRFNGSDGEKEFTLTSPHEKHLVTGLEPDTYYAFRVAAQSSRGQGELSESVVTKTAASTPTGPPTLTSLLPLSPSTLSASWLAPDPLLRNGPLTVYRLRYRVVQSENSSLEPADESSWEYDSYELSESAPVEWQQMEVNATMTTANISQLASYSVYEVTVAAATDKGYGPESVPFRIRTKENVPSAPRNFDVILSNPNTAKLTWESPGSWNGHHGGYYIYAEKLLNGVPQNQRLHKTKAINDHKRTYTEIDNLEPNTEYAFRMNAFNRNGDGEFTESRTLVTGGIPPQQPEIQSVVLLSEEPPLKARVDWKRPQLAPLESPIDRFNVWYRPEGSLTFNKKIVNGTETSAELTGLWMGRVYEIVLGAENVEGISANATEKLETPAGNPDGEPLNVHYEITNQQMRVSWDQPAEDKRNGNITVYKAILTPMDSEGDRVQKEVSDREVTFSVDPRKAYTFKVAAATMKGVGPFSPVLTINPDPDAHVSTPTNVRVEATSNSTAVVQWDFEPGTGSQVDGFVVRYLHEPSQRRDDKWVSRTVQSPLTRHLAVGHLTANMPYAFCVVAIKNNRQGACSDPPTVLAKMTPDYMVSELKVQWKTSHSVSVEWQYNGPTPVRFYFNHTGKKEYFDQNMALKTMTTPGFRQELDGSTRLFLLTNLRPYMTYTLHVGVISNNRQYWPQEVTVMTDPTGPPYVEVPSLTVGDNRPGQATFRLKPATEEYGPIDYYWIVVVPGNYSQDDVVNLDQSRLLRLTEERRNLLKSIRASPAKKLKRDAETQADDSVEEMTSSTEQLRIRARRDLPAAPYITAKLNSAEMQTMARNDNKFVVGDDRKYNDVHNWPLEPNTKYRVLMRAFAKKEAKSRQNQNIVPMTEKLSHIYSDSALSEAFSTPRSPRQGGKAGGMWLIGPFIALLIIALLIGMLVCWWLRCNKKSAGRGHRHGSITKVALTGNIMNGGGGGPGETSKLLSSSDYSGGGRPVMNPYEQLNGSGLAGNCMESSLDLYPMPASHSRLGGIGSGSGNYAPVPVPLPCLPSNGFGTLGGGGGGHSLSHPAIPIAELANHIERLRVNNNAGFQQEFESIETGQHFTWDHSNAEMNKHKNRYANVVAYDHSRVILSSMDGLLGTDYINANYIDGFDKPRAYIATQGPLPETFGDFWRMVWEENSSTIVMLTNLEERSRVKCDQYWPSRGTSTYGDIQVTLLETTTLAHYTMRALRIEMDGENETREIRHLQYTAWPDHGVPDHPTPFLIFLKRVKTMNPPDAGPIVSHCSAGIGRTGAFIVIDCMLERLRYENTVDIFGCVTALRGQRSYMVQTEDQYVFIHDAVLDAVNSGSTEVPASKLQQHLQQIKATDGHGVSGIEMEFRHLSTLKWSNNRCGVANLPGNRHKNRQLSVVPFDNNRLILRNIPGVDGSDYINASWVDGYKERCAYMATQAPMEQTMFDFWRMIWEHESAIIVMIVSNWEMERGDVLMYWPLETGTQMGNLVVEPITEYNLPEYRLREFRLSDMQTGMSRTVRHFQYAEWPEQGTPKSAEHFIQFVQQVHRTKTQFGVDGPIAVHCSNGAGRSGAFVALAILLDRMKMEHVVDVFTTVKLLRTERQSMVQDKDQYEFLYQACVEYLATL